MTFDVAIGDQFKRYWQKHNVHVVCHNGLIVATKVDAPAFKYSRAQSMAFRPDSHTEAFDEIERFRQEAR